MLRYIICSLSIILTLPGCEDSISNRPGLSTFGGQLQITDTNRLPRAVFRSAEEFIVSWYITNTTMRRIACEYTGPPVRFNLTQGDSVISSSVDSWVLVV